MMRRRLELGLRVVAMLALLAALWSLVSTAMASAHPIATGETARDASETLLASTVLRDTTGAATVSAIVPALFRTAAPRPAVHANMRVVSSVAVRGALQAARAASVAVTWTDSTGARGLAISAAALPDPAGRIVVRAVGASSPLVVRDAAGVLDSQATNAMTVETARLARNASVTAGASTASVRVPAAPVLKRLLILANAGFEAKLAMAALEEQGWLLDGRLQLSPRTFVTMGRAASLDTARYAAVFVLDSGVATASVLARFARTGGGVVIVGDALRDASLSALVPARVGAWRTGVPGALLTAAPRDGLALAALAPVGAATVLQFDGIGTRRTSSVVARRLGVGRVVAVGYRDSWRWRMEGNDDGVAAHRAWWAMLASSASFASPPDSATTASTALPGDAAPHSDLVARIGAPTLRTAGMVPSGQESSSTRLLFLLATVALLVEWGSRRLRGAA